MLCAQRAQPTRRPVVTPGARFAASLLGLAIAGCSSQPQATVDNSVGANPTADVSASSTPAIGSSTAESSAVQFVDATQKAGIGFRHNNGAFGGKWAPDTMGSGVAFLDYDGDGYQDIFLVNGRNWSQAEYNAYRSGSYIEHHKRYKFVLPPNKPAQRTTGALYHNNRDGTFSDATRNSGLDVEMYGMGASPGDYDNDGRGDLMVTSLGRSYLFHNQGGGRFRDVTASAGVKGSGWGTSAAWVDYDRDGKLDLFVCTYTGWAPERDAYQNYQGQKAVSGPEPYPAQASHLYRNLGKGRFEDVSSRAGISVQPGGARRASRAVVGKALGVAVCDYNNDEWLDIVVTNDREPNFLFRNNGGGTFSEVAAQSGIAYGPTGKARAGMGIDAGDIDHSNRESLAITNFSREMIGLYRNLGNGALSDIAEDTGVGRTSWPFLGFGCLFTDVDNDGWPDLFVANGHVNDIDPTSALMRPLLFRNQGSLSQVLGGGKWKPQSSFSEIGLQSGAAMSKKLAGRGVAAADIDLDGDSDIIVSCNNGAPLLLRNDGGSQNNALRVILRGTKSNRDGIGAGVWAQVGSELLRRRVKSGSSYLSQSELPVTFGLGRSARAELVAVRWPSGKLMQFPNIHANQIITIDESRGIVKRQKMQR